MTFFQSSQFMDFYKSEHTTRGGCPADWIWIVPPISGALVPTWHQEMLDYKISPSYEYQKPLWVDLMKRKRPSFKILATLMMYFNAWFRKRYTKRKEALIFYATMTGTAKLYATKLRDCLEQQFRTRICPLDEKALELLSTKEPGKKHKKTNKTLLVFFHNLFKRELKLLALLHLCFSCSCFTI